MSINMEMGTGNGLRCWLAIRMDGAFWEMIPRGTLDTKDGRIAY